MFSDQEQHGPAPGFTPTTSQQTGVHDPGLNQTSTQPRFPAPFSTQNAGFPVSTSGSFTPPNSVQQQRPGFPPLPAPANKQPVPGFPPMSAPNQRPGFPPAPQTGNQQPGMPPSAGVRPGFPPPPTSSMANQQPGFPPRPSYSSQVKGFPPHSQPGMAPPTSSQQPGFPPAPAANQQPGFPQPPQSMANQHTGFPPPIQQGANQQPGFPPGPTNQPSSYQQRPGQSIQDFVNSTGKQNMGMNAMQTNFSNMSLQVINIVEVL